MPKVVITINTDNAAFDDDFSQEMEYVLSQAPKVITQSDGGKLRDSNGNTVGEIKVTMEDTV
jgi:hypothetical protein